MNRDTLYARTERFSLVVIAASLLVLLLVWATGCTPAPKPLTPQAQAAFYGTRVVQVLDVFRDAAIAGNAVTPPLVSTDSTRRVVLFHKSAVQVISVTPTGWRPSVKAGLFELSCHPLAAPAQPPPPCTPLLAPAEVVRLYPYIGLALVVIEEVR
jgi:hypothetical protein